MLSIDFQPPCEPTLDEQSDALKKGLGRAHVWAEAGSLDDDLLLAACLNDSRHDQQVEPSRSPWVWAVVEKAGAKERLRAPILQALRDIVDDRDAPHICEIAFHYAHEGDEAFRDRLRELVDHPVDPPSDMAHSEVLKLDGADGFWRVARARGNALACREWEWGDEIFLDNGVELLGRDCVHDLLARSSHEGIRRLRELWPEKREAEEAARREPPFRDRVPSISAEQVIATAGSNDGDVDLLDLHFWGLYTSEERLQAVFEHLLASNLAPRVLSDMLSVFSQRSFPRFDDRLIAFCRHEDELVRHKAFYALKQLRDPRVRSFALDQIERLGDPRAVTLLVNHFEPGDEARILRSIDLPEDQDQFHWTLMDVIDLLETNPSADASRLGVTVYALTPCMYCRSRAHEQLEARAAVPAWMAEEYPLDAYHFEDD